MYTEKDYKKSIDALNIGAGLTLFLYSLGLCFLFSCNTSKKSMSSEQTKEATDSTSIVEQQTKTEKILTESGSVNLIYNASSPCANLFNYNVNTGEIKAEGALTGVSIQKEKQAKETQEDKFRNITKTINNNIHTTKTEYKSKGLPWYLKTWIIIATICTLIQAWQLYRWIRKTFYLPTPVI